jgi:(2Fe-2S) ferredoxin
VGYYQKQIFFCHNLRQNGKRCCGANDADAFFDYMKKTLKKRLLHGIGQFRVNTSSCLGRCEEGPVLVIYPEGIWYSYKTYTDIDEIIEQHLLQGKIVSRLQLSGQPPDVNESNLS